MELIKKEIRCNNAGKQTLDQFLVDDDVNVPDAKSDVARIILSEGKVRIEDIRLVENYARVIGKIFYQILYATDEVEPKLSALYGQMPFEEMVYLEEEPKGQIHLKSGHTELTVSMIHSRKINIKAMTELVLGTEWEREEMLTLDIQGKLYKKYKNTNVLKLQMVKKDTYRIKEELKLSGTKENVGSLLWTKVSLRKLDTRIGKDELVLRGELQVFCFYESPEGKIDWIEQIVPYEGRIQCLGTDDRMYHHIYADMVDENIDVRMDEDGEMRILGVEATLEIRALIYDEEDIQILNDVYSLQEECVPQLEELTFESLVMQNHSKYKLLEQLALPEIKDNILQICHSSGHIQVEHTELVAEGIMVEGILHIFFLYVKADDQVPFDIWQGSIPFTHVIETKDMSVDMNYDIGSELEQLSIGLLGNDSVEVKAVLAFRLLLRKEEKVRNISNIIIRPIDMEKAEKAPGIVGYFVKEGDELWELAKKYHTTIDGIREVNGLQEELIKPGDKILIFKENMSIL